MEGHERRGSLFCRVSGGSGALENQEGRWATEHPSSAASTRPLIDGTEEHKLWNAMEADIAALRAAIDAHLSSANTAPAKPSK